jgi:hypothetical protein
MRVFGIDIGTVLLEMRDAWFGLGLRRHYRIWEMLGIERY